MRKTLIAPSILSADFANLKKDVEAVEKAGADWLHIDVMDGHFVPNISIGPLVVKALRPHSKLFFDVHLMIDRPDIYWKSFKESGADLIVFHCEAIADPGRLIKEIKSSGIKAGMSLKPKTDTKNILKFIEDLDLVLIMTVEPGFGGQQYMHDMTRKITEFRQAVDKKGLKCLVEVDGGINPETAGISVKAGADVLVAGNAVFAKGSIEANMKSLRASIDNSLK